MSYLLFYVLDITAHLTPTNPVIVLKYAPKSVSFILTRRWKWVNLFVNDGHNGVVKFLQEVRDRLVGQECCHRSQQQVDEDEHHREEILQTGFTESHRWIGPPNVILCCRDKGVKAGIWVDKSNYMPQKRGPIKIYQCNECPACGAETRLLLLCEMLLSGFSCSGSSVASSKKTGDGALPSSSSPPPSSSSSLNCRVKKRTFKHLFLVTSIVKLYLKS